MICVVIARTRRRMALAELEAAAKRGAPLVELRLDFLTKPLDFKKVLAEKPCPVVITVRRPEDGGRWSGTEEARQMMLRQAIVAGFDWVDLETDIAGVIRRFKNVKRIISYHNLQETPDDLEQIYETMCGQDPDVVKIAVTAQQPSDNLRVLELVKKSTKPTVAFCMGEIGFPSRILGAKFGAPFTYAALTRERRIAPGLPTFAELQKVYHYDRIHAETEVYGVVGDPIAQSVSPAVHNAALKKLGLNGVYLPFRVPRGQFQGFLQAFEKVPVKGYSVTIPHKEDAMTAARKRDPLVALIQAANTLVRGPDGFTAYNTDIQAARDSLNAHMATAPGGEEKTTLEGKTVMVLGAGGAARAVGHALDQEGALIVITNRTAGRGQKLAEELDCRYAEWKDRMNTLCDVLINCTSLGMYPHVDQTPIHPSYLKPGLVVFDTVYNPENTLLVKEARERGCHVLTGVDMFVRQAALQFKLFTGQEAPREVLVAAVKRALSPVALPDEEEEGTSPAGEPAAQEPGGESGA